MSKLPADGLQKAPSSEVVVNICGALNHLVTCSSSAARDICHFNGIPKLMGIKTSHDSRYVYTHMFYTHMSVLIITEAVVVFQCGIAPYFYLS